jgi:hypothetical protein
MRIKYTFSNPGLLYSAGGSGLGIRQIYSLFPEGLESKE